MKVGIACFLSVHTLKIYGHRFCNIMGFLTYSWLECRVEVGYEKNKKEGTALCFFLKKCEVHIFTIYG